MPLKPPQPVPRTQRDWDQWARKIEIKPDDGTVGTVHLINDSVTDEKLRDSAAQSVIGNPTGSAADPQDISASANGTFLGRRDDELAFVAIQDSDVPSSIARDTEVTAAIEAHEAEDDPHPGYTTSAEVAAAITAHEGEDDPHSQYTQNDEDEQISGDWSFTAPPVLPAYTVETLPDATAYARGLIYVSDETGGAVPAFSDGTNWRRVTDRAVVS